MIETEGIITNVVNPLIQCVEKSPSLYLKSLKEYRYSDVNVRKKMWEEVCLEEPKTKRPTKPMTKRRARMMKRRKVYDAILDMDDHLENALKEMNMDFKTLNKRNFTKIYLQKRAERMAEEARLDALAALSSTEPPILELTTVPVEPTTEQDSSTEWK